MRAQLQLKLPVLLGCLFFLMHALVCVALWRASLANIEFGALWEHMRITDLPVSLLSDWFYDAYEAVTNGIARQGYHTPYFCFHFILGGIQFFAWGWALGSLWRWSEALRTGGRGRTSCSLSQCGRS